MNDNNKYDPGKHAFKDVGKNKYSSYWLGDSARTYKDKALGELVKMNSTRKAVSNFVKITTGKDIPVEIKGQQSYTDSKKVVISADTDNFDILVGLALHEASHIAKSDFSLVKKLVDQINGFTTNSGVNWRGLSSFRDFENLKNVKNGTVTLKQCFILLKSMANYIEDRRIDVWQCETSPGYKGYYKSFYNKYFYNVDIDKGLRSQEMRDERIRSYEFRIINLHNPESDLDALKALRDIYNTIDLKNISRLNNTKEVFDVAFEVTRLIVEALDPNQPQSTENDQNQNDEPQIGDGEDDQSEGGGNQSADSDDSQSSSSSKSSEDENEDENEDGSGNGSGNSDEDISREDLEKILDDLVEKYDNNFQDEKIEASSDQINKLKSLESSKAEYKNSKVGTDDARVLVLRKFDLNLIKNFPDLFYSGGHTGLQEAVEEGLRNGKILGKKLKIRNDVKTVTNTRKKHGGIDRRLISELGYGNKRVFVKKRKIENNDVFMHITIDASGSMWYTSFVEALKMASSIAMAASMVEGFRVVISTRSDNSNEPYVLICYDSDVDKISKIRNLFKYLSTPGCTPEGLCYDTILQDIIKVGKGVDSYFVNMSDGYPGCTYRNKYGTARSYGGDSAIEHTGNVVKKIIKNGVHVISYLIGGYEDSLEKFKKMYGKDSHSINANDITSIAKTLNDKFSKAANR